MTENQTVLRLITRLNIGGPARQALLLTKELHDQYPTLLGAGTSPANEGELQDAGVSVRRLPLVREIDPVSDARSFFEIRRLIGSTRCSIVHSHMAKAGALARLAARSSRTRPLTVHTFHGHVLEGYFSPSVQKAFVAIERWLARRTDVLIAISSEVRESLLQLGIGEPEQFRLIPLGFDLSLFQPTVSRSRVLRQQLGLDDADLLVGILGRLTRIKDHRVTIDAIGRLPGVHLVVLGDGEDRGALERYVLDSRIGDRIHFLGWRLDVPAVMADLDMVVLSSRNEGTPVSLIEAGAAGLPVVSTEVGGVASVVLDERTGLLVPPGDPTSLAHAMNRLLSNPELRRRFGAAAREHAIRSFSKERLVDDIRLLYDELIDRRS